MDCSIPECTRSAFLQQGNLPSIQRRIVVQPFAENFQAETRAHTNHNQKSACEFRLELLQSITKVRSTEYCGRCRRKSRANLTVLVVCPQSRLRLAAGLDAVETSSPCFELLFARPILNPITWAASPYTPFKFTSSSQLNLSSA